MVPLDCNGFIYFLGSKETSAIKRLAKENTDKKGILKSFKAEKNKKMNNRQRNRRKKKKTAN